MTRSHSNPSRLAQTLTSLSFSSPQVITSRTMRFMQPGALLSASGQAEFIRMVTEKQAAAVESYFSLVMSAFMLSQQLFAEAWCSLARGQAPRMPCAGLLPVGAVAKSANDALKPFQRRASANARRLGRSRKSL